MANNKNALLRYLVLDRCFRSKYRRFYIEDLIDECNEALYNHFGSGHKVSRRQIFDDIKFMESDAGWSIPLERIQDGKRVYYRYDGKFSINERPLEDEEMNILTQAIQTLSRFTGLPQFEWMETLLTTLEDKFYLKGNSQSIIGFEQNQEYKAAQHLSSLFNAIVNKQVLSVSYKTFKGAENVWTIHPYYIKQYNNRWFLFGYNPHVSDLSVIPLDRIESFENVDDKYINNEDIDFEEYFNDVIGVTVPQNQKCWKVLMKFDAQMYPYIKSKPIHKSMNIVNEDEGLIEVDLKPNNEFESLLFSFAEHCEVLEPLWLREKISGRVAILAKKYFIGEETLHNSRLSLPSKSENESSK